MILVADDNIDVRNLLFESLTMFGYEVILAVDGQDAVERFAAHADSIRLVLMDVIMPRKNGIQSCREIMQLRSDTKVLLLSGYAAEILDDPTVLNGGVELVKKPFSPVALAEKIRIMLDDRGKGIDAPTA